MPSKMKHYSSPVYSGDSIIGYRALCAEVGCLKPKAGELTQIMNDVSCGVCRDILEERLTKSKEVEPKISEPTEGDLA